MVAPKLEIKSLPADNELEFIYSGNSGKMTFSICDSNGNIVNEGKVVPGEKNTVGMDRWKRGVYWIYINDKDKIVRQKFTRH
jgi:hypothetical protein